MLISYSWLLFEKKTAYPIPNIDLCYHNAIEKSPGIGKKLVTIIQLKNLQALIKN